jgi:hypothetical protein
MSEALTGNLMFNGVIHDWQYAREQEGDHSEPNYTGEYDDPSEDVVINDFLNLEE